jgi:hypothetical protein
MEGSFFPRPAVPGSHALAFRVTSTPSRENRACRHPILPKPGKLGALVSGARWLDCCAPTALVRGSVRAFFSVLGKGILSKTFPVERLDAAWQRTLHRDPSTPPQSPFPFASSGPGVPRRSLKMTTRETCWDVKAWIVARFPLLAAPERASRWGRNGRGASFLFLANVPMPG